MPENNNEMVEVSKDKLGVLENALTVLNGLWDDDSIGLEVRKKASEAFPNLVKDPGTKMLDRATAPLKTELEETRKYTKTLEDRLNKWEQDHKDAAEQANLEFEIAKVQAAEGFTNEGMAKVVALAKEKNIPNIEAAAALYLKQQPKPKPVIGSSLLPTEVKGFYGSNEKDEMWADLNNDPFKAFDKETINILNNPQEYLEFGGTK